MPRLTQVKRFWVRGSGVCVLWFAAAILYAQNPQAVLNRAVTEFEQGQFAASAATFDELVLNVTAKTYRYLDEDEVNAAAAAEEGKASRGKGKARTTRETSKGNKTAKAKPGKKS